ncbi:hypothetical protein Tco_1079015 [Tanacetum coccineum]|uniref:Uncharacterized protein n=1 Tax=Tanacetum coccineum TaxID=301880 RepID=A0ABQ5HR47_9ASTR
MSCTTQSLLLFIHQEVGCPGAAWAMARGGGAPFDVGFFAGNENADPTDMGIAEQHQNIARREWDELRSSREWISVENHFARCDRKIDAIFEKARSMYRDGHLVLDIEDESDIKRGLDAYFSDLHDFSSGGQINKKCHKSTGNAIGSDRKEGGLGLLASLSDSCASRGEPASSGVAFHPKHTTAIAECSLKPVHSREKPVQGLARAVEEDDYLKPLFQAGTGDVDSTESAYAKQRGLKASRWWQDGGLMLILNKVLLLPSLTSKGKGVKLNASLAHSERISTLAEVEKGEEGTSCLREEALREQGASLLLSERPIEREVVNQLSGLGLLVSEGCFGKAYERLSFDGRSVAGKVNTRKQAKGSGVKDGSSSLSALLAASSQLSSKCWFACVIVRISSTMSTELSTRNHFFDILEKIKQFRVSKLMVVTVGSSPKCIKTLGSTIPRPALGCVKPRADTNKSVPLIPPNTEPPKGRPVPTSKIVRAKERVNLVFGSMPIVDHVVSFPMESEGAVDGREIIGLSSSIVGKLSSLKRIDQQATLHAVTIEEIRVEISESSLLHPYISSISLAKKEVKQTRPKDKSVHPSFSVPDSIFTFPK